MPAQLKVALLALAKDLKKRRNFLQLFLKRFHRAVVRTGKQGGDWRVCKQAISTSYNTSHTFLNCNIAIVLTSDIYLLQYLSHFLKLQYCKIVLKSNIYLLQYLSHLFKLQYCNSVNKRYLSLTIPLTPF